jgi:PadR family transcriptional regulator, regulatory protein PadR
MNQTLEYRISIKLTNFIVKLGILILDIGHRASYPNLMSVPKIRMTAVIMDVLDVLTSSPSDDPAWGLRLCEATGYGTGTIYPALDRLMKAGWIADRWEDPRPEGRPRRRYYEITSTGREQYTAALRARGERRTAWLHSTPHLGVGA